MNTPLEEDIYNFTQQIEKIRTEKQVPYIDAIVEYCEKTELEIEMAAKLLNSNIINEIKEYAENLHLLKPSEVTSLQLT